MCAPIYRLSKPLYVSLYGIQVPRMSLYVSLYGIYKVHHMPHMPLYVPLYVPYVRSNIPRICVLTCSYI